MKLQKVNKGIKATWCHYIKKDYDLNKTGYSCNLKGCALSYLKVGIKLPFVLWYLETRQVYTLYSSKLVRFCQDKKIKFKMVA